MKYLIIFILLLSCNYLTAQKFLITYEFYSKLDTIVYKLAMSEDQSVFYKEDNEFLKRDIKFDSISSYMFHDGNSNDDFLYDEFDNVSIKARVNKNLHWSFKGNGLNYLNYSTNLAVTEYQNKRWYVFFTTDIPILTGPFIFNDLPGLVLKAINIDTGEKFIMTGIQKIDNDIETFQLKLNKAKEIELNKYKKIINSHEENNEKLIDFFLNIDGIKADKNNVRKTLYNPLIHLL